MKTLVIYKSLSGFTKKYAGWIAEELRAELLDIKFLKKDTLTRYGTIIFGGSLHVTGISGVDIIKKKMGKLKDKNIIIFAVGASPANDAIVKELIEKNFSAEEQNKIKLYYLRGGFNFDKLDILNKIIMTLLKWKLYFKKNKSPDEAGMLAAFSKPVDFTRKENINIW